MKPGRVLTIAEEIFPLLFYFSRIRTQKEKVNNVAIGESLDLGEEEIKERLKQEHDRAKAMDEKTFKMTLALSLGLTVLGSTISVLAEGTEPGRVRFLITLLGALAVFYSFLGGLVALGALKTLPSYGYGTDFMIQFKADRKVGMSALAAQEAMNIIRHLRNETAYQCLRNGFVCLFGATILCALVQAVDALF
jgi:hypothetical protein